MYVYATAVRYCNYTMRSESATVLNWSSHYSNYYIVVVLAAGGGGGVIL